MFTRNQLFSPFFSLGSGGVPRTTPFIHRDTTFYMLSNLDPDSQYEVDVYLIPVPDSKIELISNTTLTFKTLPPVQGME